MGATIVDDDGGGGGETIVVGLAHWSIDRKHHSSASSFEAFVAAEKRKELRERGRALNSESFTSVVSRLQR